MNCSRRRRGVTRSYWTPKPGRNICDSMSTNKTSRFQRIAKTDPEAVAYFKEYFKDSGYGDLLVEDMPKKIKAALAKAAKAEWAFVPRGIAVDAGLVHIEGAAVSDADALRFFRATFKGAELTDFVSVEG